MADILDRILHKLPGDDDEGKSETRVMTVRMPATLHQAAGARSEPPKSLPLASATMPHARAPAEPPLEPPQVSPRS